MNKNLIQNCAVNNLWLEYFDQAILAGGAIRSKFDSTDIEDYDFFFGDQKILIDVVKALETLKSHSNWQIVFRCPRNRLFSLRNNFGVKVQLIYPGFNFKDLKTLIDSFDFTVSQFAVASDGRMLTGEYSITDANNRQLRVNKVSFPISTMKRIEKYAKKGYVAMPSVYIEISRAIVELNETEKMPELPLMEYYSIESPWSFNGID